MTGDIPAKRQGGRLYVPALLFSLLVLAIVFSGEIMRGLQDALALCANVILPSLFPFMVLSELLGESLAECGTEKSGGGLCRRLFGVSRVGMSAFVLGALCGFPLGVKHARTLYDGGAIDEKECVRLVCIANNTGPAFVIAGVGGGLFTSFRLGVWLYAIQITAALIVALIFARIPAKESGLTRKKTDAGRVGIVGAIRKSTMNVLTVCGMVVFFSGVCALIGIFVKNSNLLLFIYPFLEVGGACSLAASFRFSQYASAVFASLLSICFGGLSVHMQAVLFFENGGFPLARYFAAKLTQSAIGCILLALCFPFMQ